MSFRDISETGSYASFFVQMIAMYLIGNHTVEAAVASISLAGVQTKGLQRPRYMS